MKQSFATGLGIAALLVSTSGHCESLLEVYQQALQSDPLVREAEANRMAAEETVPQARGSLLPQISASGSYTDSDSDGNAVFPQVQPDGSVLVVSSQTEQDAQSTSWQVDLTQTLFRWDQIIGMRRAGKRVAQAHANYEFAQQDLIVRVAERYFSVLAAQDSLLAAEASKRAIARQLDQAQQRFEVGLIAITDVQESQAAYDLAIADEIAAKRTLATSKEFLREITGEYIGELNAPKPDIPLVVPSPADADQWVATAIDQNLSLQASRLNAELARDEIRSRRSGHYPTLDLFARITDFDSDATRDDRIAGAPINLGPQPADSENQGNTIGIQLNVPIFSGGVTSSRVREAVYQYRAAREQLQRIARETERQARDSYLGVESDIARVNALARALQSSQTALEASEAGLEVGTRTTVDVLDAQRAVFNAFTGLERSRYDYILNILRLKQAAGILRVQDLEEIEAWLIERPASTVPVGIKPVSG